MAKHTIEPERSTVHGHFSKSLPSILAIDSGDTVSFRTLEAGWSLEPPSQAGAKSDRYIEPRIKGKDDGHCLCGPVAINGAQPGMTLEIGIDQIITGTWGWSGAGQHDELGIDEQGWLPYLWQLDAEKMIGVDNEGHRLALQPFMGVMGMPPDEPGDHGTGPPRQCGGNLDCKELIAGTRLLLPIAVAGGLFSVGDGHAVQGDGEVSGVAIECPMERVVVCGCIQVPIRSAVFHSHRDRGRATLIGHGCELQTACRFCRDVRHGWIRDQSCVAAYRGHLQRLRFATTGGNTR